MICDKTGLQRLAPLALGIGLLVFLWHEARALDLAAVAQAVEAIPAWRWGFAALASAASFLAIAQYDVIAHKHFRTGCPPGQARLTGAAAVAVGQTTGFGPIVGGLVRWRRMQSLGGGTIARITGFVTTGFLVAWGIIAVTLALPLLAGLPWLAVLFPLATAGLIAALVCWPRVTGFGTSLDLPSLPAAMQLLALALCDLGCAALVLWLLLPPEAAPGFAYLFAGFTLALGAGLIGGTPGGVGPFELALVALLPAVGLETLAAALIGFRLLYHALPFVLGAAVALWSRPDLAPPRRAPPARAPAHRAEAAIAAQTPHRAIRAPGSEGLALRTTHSLALFLGPSQGALAPLLPALRRAAREENRLSCLYKLTARDAAEARACGWHVAAFAREAVIAPRDFSLSGPERRQLRRHLRKAEAAKLSYRRVTAPDWSELEALSAAWVASHGAERGLTMGRFCPLYLSDKVIFGAYKDGQLVGFTTWLEAPGAWHLDIIRHGPGLPNGSMHGLIHAVIVEAQRCGKTEVNLAALPHPDLPAVLQESEGLSRFKTSFAPRWRALYIAAPTPGHLLLAGADIRRSILRPAPLWRSDTDAWDLDALSEAPVAEAPVAETPVAETPEAAPLRKAG